MSLVEDMNRTAERAVDRLSPQDGDVILIRGAAEFPDEAKEAMRKHDMVLEAEGKHVLFILAVPGATLESLDETAMNAAGWYRKT